MGLFDTIKVKCPHCAADAFIQVEGNEAMNIYTPEDAPLFALRQAMNGAEHCENCDGWFTLADPRAPLVAAERPPVATMKLRPPKNPRVHPQGMKWWPDEEPFGPENLMN